MTIYDEVNAERAKQDEQWGGSKHDDAHELLDWVAYMEHQLYRATTAETDAEWRERLIKVAALAVAAVESLDRWEKCLKKSG